MKTVLLKSRYKGTPLHSLYNDLIANPPAGYKIITPNIPQKNVMTNMVSKSHNYYYKTLMYYLAPLPSFLYQVTESSFNYELYDMVYASQHVISTERPWIVDFEYANALAVYGDLTLCKNIISRKLRSKSCKAILPWSDWATETLLSSIDCNSFKDKITVLRYTVPPKKIPTVHKDKSLTRILFLGSNNLANIESFEFKGLYETVEAFIEIQEKYADLELVIRSVVPVGIKEMVKNYSNIKILEKPLPYEELEKLFLSSDIFAHSGFEVLNISVLEAMSYGLPVIATSLYNTPELIEHLKNGLLIELPDPSLFYGKNKTLNDYSKAFLKSMRSLRPYMKNKLKEYFKLLIEDSSLRQKISREAFLTIEKGKFSFTERNRLLGEIFEITTS